MAFPRLIPASFRLATDPKAVVIERDEDSRRDGFRFHFSDPVLLIEAASLYFRQLSSVAAELVSMSSRALSIETWLLEPYHAEDTQNDS